MSVANEGAAAAAAAARLIRLDAESDARALAPCSECGGSGVDETVRPSAGRPGLAFPCRACGGVGASAAAVEDALSARLAAAAAAASGMRAAVVALEGDSERGGSFAALVEGSRWNGWARCWFARAEVERMMLGSGFFVMTDSDAPALRWGGGGVLLEGSEDGEDRGAAYWLTVPRSVFPDGVERFRVGDGWVWLEVEPCCADCGYSLEGGAVCAVCGAAVEGGAL